MNNRPITYEQHRQMMAAGTPVKKEELAGDKLHKVLGPIGAKTHWPCMKGDGTTNLKPKSLCNYLMQTLNTADRTVRAFVKSP